MNTHPETPAPTDPTDLAREVLDDERAWAALDPGHHPESQAAVYRLANAAPDLARAVIRVEELADRLEHEAAYEASRGDTWDATCIRAEARRIRRALNGGDQ